MKLSELHIIVVGGAIGGAATALLLARAGARVSLFERVAQPRAVGAGIAIAANGLAVLESIGLGPAITSVARQVGAPRIVDGKRRTMLRPPSPSPRIVMVRRSTLHSIMLDALAAEPLVELHFGADVVSSSRDGCVLAVSETGEQRLQGDLIVGADGVRSRVRESGDFGARIGGPGIAYVRTLVGEGLALDEEAWTRAGLFGSFAVDGGTYVYASASSPECRAAVVARDLDGFREAWSTAYEPSREILAGIESWDDVIVNRVLRVECERWHDGRLALLGDAAHAMPPNLGQGANSALVDAAVLLDELRRARFLDEALAAYDCRRRPAVTKVASSSARLGALAEPGGAARRWMRDHILMPLLDRVSNESTVATIMQEPPERLLAIGRA